MSSTSIFENQDISIDKFFYWFTILRLKQRVQMMMTFQKHSIYKDFLSCFSTMVTPCSQPINEGVRQWFLKSRIEHQGKDMMSFFVS